MLGIRGSHVIVTCEECTTSFQLEEERIPPGGARVRCSRCKHAFFLPRPCEPDPLHAIAEEAAADATAGTPEPSRDLNEHTWDGLGGEPVQIGGGQPSPTNPTDSMTDPVPPAQIDDEEDWQFSEEIRVEGDDDLEEDFAPESDGELDFGGSADFSEGFDESALALDASESLVEVAAPEEPPIASAALGDTRAGSGLDLDVPPALPDAAPERDESSFGSVDDFSSLMEDEVPASNEAVSNLASQIASKLDAEDGYAGLYASSGQSEDLGDPESWDLVGNDDGALRIPAGTPASAALQASVEEDEFFGPEAFGDTPEEADLRTTSVAMGVIGKAARAIGWLVTAAAAAAVTVIAFQAEWARFSPSPQAVSAGPITAETLGSGWVETTRAGTLLRFEGAVRNTATTPVFAPGVTLTLLDSAGERLAAAPVLRAGVPLAESSIRESAPTVLAERVAAASRRFARTPIAPGGSLRFEALVPAADLPERASRVLLEVSEPRPATTQAERSSP